MSTVKNASLNDKDRRADERIEKQHARNALLQEHYATSLSALPQELRDGLAGEYGYDLTKMSLVLKDDHWLLCVGMMQGGVLMLAFSDTRGPATLWDDVVEVLRRDEWRAARY